MKKENCIGFMADLLFEYLHANIYHYEKTELKLLDWSYALCDEQLNNLLSNQKFIDLYLVEPQSICTSEPSYSIKNVKAFYVENGANAVVNIADSIIFYNKWPEIVVGELLQEISDYNAGLLCFQALVARLAADI